MTTAEVVLDPPVSEEKTDASPYKGLDYYRQEDETRFAGRQADVFELTSRVLTSRTLVLYGRSGLGKTSLLLAGVFPALRSQGYERVYVRTLQHPLNDLKAAIRLNSSLDPEGTLELRELVGRATAKGTVLLVFDQFEEFFIRFTNQPELRRDFVAAVAELIRDDECDVRIIFSLREDYLAALDDFQRALPDLFVNAYRLLPLTPLAARQAIVAPLKRDGIQYDEHLVSRLVDELAAFNFDSARLQIACTELYDTANARATSSVGKDHQDSATRLTQRDLDDVRKNQGDLEGVFRRYVQHAIEAVPSQQHPLARNILDMLITRADTKFAISRAELLELKFADDDEVSAVIDKLVERKIIRQETRGEEEWYELIHECLVPEIKRWLEENNDFANFRLARDLIGYYSREGRFRDQKGLLLSADTLSAMVSPHKDQFRLTSLQVEFLLWSAIAAHAEDIPYWMGRMEQPAALRLLRQLLAKEDADLRAGAAIATRCCDDDDRDLVRKCMELALDKTEPSEVRSAAGQTVALMATNEELACIRTHLRLFHRTPPHIRELLAHLEEKNRVRSVFGRWRAKVARRWLGQRLLEQKRVELGRIAASGAIRGLLAALCWAFTSGILYSVLFDWICNPFSTELLIQKVYYYVGWPILPGILLGALVGWRISRLTLQTQVPSEKHFWSVVIRASHLLRWILFPPALILSGTAIAAIWQYLELRNEFGMFFVGGLACVAGWFLAKAIRFLLAQSAGLASRCLSGSTGSRVLWTVIPNIALSIAAPAIILTLVNSTFAASQLESGNATNVLVAFLFAAAAVFVIAGFLLFVITIVLGTSPSMPDTQSPQGILSKSNRIRGSFTIGAFFLVPWFLFVYGIRTIPFTVRQRPVPADGKLEAKLKRWPETNYFSLRASTTGALFRATVPTRVRFTINRRDLSLRLMEEDVVLFVPGRDVDLAISNFTQWSRPVYGPLNISFTPLPFQSARNVPVTRETKYFRCQLKPPESENNVSAARQSKTLFAISPKWRGELRAKFTDYKYDSTDQVEIIFNENSIIDSSRTFRITAISDLSSPPTNKPSADKSTSPDFFISGGEVGVFPMDSERGEGRLLDLSDAALRKTISITPEGEWAAEVLAEPGRGLGTFNSLDPVSFVVGVRLRNREATDIYKAGLRFLQLKKPAEAIQAFYKAFVKDPRNPEYANELAWALCLERRNTEAYPIAKKAVELAPMEADVWDTLAHISYANQQWKEADEAWTTAQRLAPNSLETPSDTCGEDLAHWNEAKAKAASSPSPSPQ